MFEYSMVQVKSKTDEFWNAGYGDEEIKAHPDTHPVPIKPATDENLKGLGCVVTDFDGAEVELCQWPQTGSRPVCPGTGIQAGIRSGVFHMYWEKDVGIAKNEAVGDSILVTGRLPSNVSPSNRTHVLVREANYHPDGGQVFYPQNGEAFVLLLAPPGDDVTLEDFTAFYFDGTFGVKIHPNIWHQPLYPIGESATFLDKQGANFACVNIDFVEEFGKFLLVPLTLQSS